MKKLLTAIIAVGFALSFTACGGGSGVEVSEDMQGFMTKIENTNSIMDAAAEYGYEADEMPLDLYTLEEPSVKSVKEEDGKTIYTMNVKHGMMDSDVKICWKDGKVVNIKDVPVE
ncbi:MAG TPA: hypothetical protein VJ946_11890 [Bacteroidales bacterium]|nr:hypothetical protein [Bacteroidales bacterium]